MLSRPLETYKVIYKCHRMPHYLVRQNSSLQTNTDAFDLKQARIVRRASGRICDALQCDVQVPSVSMPHATPWRMDVGLNSFCIVETV